ncbi:MAG: glycerate 2-kinase, partial [Solirubrobacteraceae bacterium]|nr:glycerate 2-kinase [Solirubrobacteraceae bacterium]
MPVLVAPAAFAGLRAPAVAAAIGRGLERAGLPPPDLCPVAGGGRGTIEVLLPALGGETGDGFVLIEDGGTAIVELGVDGRATGARIARAIDAGAQVVLVAAGGSGGLDGGAGVGEGVEDVGVPRSVEASRDGRGVGDVEAIACGGGAGEANTCAGGVGGVDANARGGREGDADAIVCGGGADTIDAIEDKGGLRGAALVVLCETRAAWTGPTATLPRDPRDVPMTAADDGLAGAL